MRLLEVGWRRVWRTARTGWGLLGLLALNVAVVLAFAKLGASVCEVPGGRCPTPFVLQSAFLAPPAQAVLARWGTAGRWHFVGVTWSLDLVFPWLYGLLLAALYAWVKATFHPRLAGPALDRLVRWSPLVAVIADLFENALSTVVALGLDPALPAGPPLRIAVAAMSVAFACKWSAVFATLAGALFGVLLSRAGAVLWTCRFGVLSLLVGSLPLIALPPGRDVLRELLEQGGAHAWTRAFTLVALVLWALSIWYWSRTLLTISALRPRPGEDARDIDDFVTAVPRWLGTLTLALAGVACLATLLTTFFEPSDGTIDVLRRNLALAAVSCLLLAWAFFRMVRARRAWLRRHGWADLPLEPGLGRPLGRAARALALVCLAASLAFLTLFTLWPVPVAGRMGTLAMAMLTAANSVFFGSAVVFLAQRSGLPIVSLSLLAAAVFSFWNDGHWVRRAPQQRDWRRQLTVRDAFHAWLRPRRQAWHAAGHATPYPVVLIAAEGGGVRAAYWTAAVLGRLQDHLDREPDPEADFTRHVFAISGVSGGSLGGAAFVALAADGDASAWGEPNARGINVPELWNDVDPDRSDGARSASTRAAPPGPYQSAANTLLGHNFLAPILAKMLSTDFAQWFLPVPFIPFDRSLALEQAWIDAYLGLRRVDGRPPPDRFGDSFLSLWDQRDLPALFLNATHVQSGRRIVASNLKVDWPEVYGLHATLGFDVSLAGAVHNSARFAYLSPAGRLGASDGVHRGHVVDGGYFETSAAATLRDVLKILWQEVGPHEASFVVVHTCNDPLECARYLPRAGVLAAAVDGSQAPEAGALGVSDPSAPLRALITTWNARGATVVSDLRLELESRGGQWVTFPVCALPDGKDVAPLSWQLSAASQHRLTDMLAGDSHCSINKSATKQVVRCLTGRACEH